MDRVDADLGADGRAGGDRAPAVHGVEPAATLDGEQEEGTTRAFSFFWPRC
jgi:hypothetical protein